ncbi:LysR family transcriptional regulator [Sphingobium sp. H39-3-25]|uniref:LysR family transcriptional regulator n=1 Tax=Sphingobium arseniciresistens TaxID=3030834 RepID=UPI0023B8D699|nr:LysR family transcriptional regulator [Sphingobium arseniciresistens]
MRYFIATAEELNFTKAAQRCGVSQPPLSRAIAQLEDEIGTRLFVRDSHHVTLTKAGGSLLEDVRIAMRSIDTGVRRAQRVAKGLQGTLSIGFGGTPAYWLWPMLIRRFRIAIPDVQINFVSMPVLKQIEALRERRIDLGIVRLPVHDEMLGTILVHREPLMVALPDNFRIGSSATDGPIKMTDLIGARFVTYAPRRGFEYHYDLRALCRLAGFEPDIAHEGETTDAIIGMVACGEGVAILPSDARRLSIHGVSFRELDVEDVPERLRTVEFGLAWNIESKSLAISEFVHHATVRTLI